MIGLSLRYYFYRLCCQDAQHPDIQGQKKIRWSGHIEIEELVEWVEKHSDNVNYFRWIAMFKKAEENLVKVPQANASGEVIQERIPGSGSSPGSK